MPNQGAISLPVFFSAFCRRAERYQKTKNRYRLGDAYRQSPLINLRLLSFVELDIHHLLRGIYPPITLRGCMTDAIKVFLWAVTKSDISRCHWGISWESPRAFMLTDYFWNGYVHKKRIEIRLRLFLPAITLFIPDSLWYEYGEKVHGDPCWFIPF